MQTEKRYLLNTTWQLTKAFWQSEHKKIAYYYLIGLLVLALFITGLTVVGTYWYRWFWDALQNYQLKKCVELLAFFIGFAAVYVISNVYQYYLQSMFCLRWRNWLTQILVHSWLENKNYYYLETLQATTDNPDQRLQEDIDLFVSQTSSLFLGAFSSIVTILSFIALLWSLSDVIKVGTWEIHGYLVWVALIYSVIGTYITHKMGKKLVFINFEKQRREADFRYQAVRLRQNVENIALYNSEPNEQKTLLTSFKHVIDITRQLIQRQKILMYFTSGFGQIALIIPILASMPMYFAKKIQIGGIIQISSAFGQVQGSMAFIISAYTTIAQWRSVVIRLIGFVDHLNAAQAIKQKHHTVSKQSSTDNSMSGQGLAIKTQTGETLFQNLNILFQPGKRYLLQGPTGIGKSTLIKVLAGLWPFADGLVTLPDGKKIMMLPQRTYMPLGSLRDALLYPELTDIEDNQLTDLLKQFNLAKLIPFLNETKNWGQVLSLGEQQKLAFIRVILHKADWVFLDETSSALDLASEGQAYGLLKKYLPDCTIISIAHRQSLAAYHDEVIDLNLQAETLAQL